MKLSYFRFLGLLICAVYLLAVSSPSQAQFLLEGDASGCNSGSYEDWVGTGTKNALVLECSFFSDNDQIVIIPTNTEFDFTVPWHENINDQNAIWLLDAGGDGLINLIIRFSKNNSLISAEIFDDVDGDKQVAYAISGDEIRIAENDFPAVLFISSDGYWRTPDHVTPNLDITIDGAIGAMMGYDRFMYKFVTDGSPEFEIRVRDTDGDGYANYDFRRDVSSLPKDWGLFRVNLHVNERRTLPFIKDFILWPFLGTSYGEAQTTVIGKPEFSPYRDVQGKRSGHVQEGFDSLMPAVQIDWGHSRIAFFAEIVPSRATDYGWYVYSIPDFIPGAIYDGNFENPFAFYDLAQNDDGVPELLIRAESIPPNDPHYMDGDYKHPLSMIRYVWKQYDLNKWDYAVNLLGMHSTQETEVQLDEDLVLNTIAYDKFPSWVMDRDWEVATFVQAMEGFTGLEGIYVGSNLNDIRDNLVAGNGDAIFVEELLVFEPGYRVEYVIASEIEPMLYMSPVDRQLHLQRAQGGRWNINGNDSIEYKSFDANYLNYWKHTFNGNLIEELVILPDHLIYISPDRIDLYDGGVAPALFTVKPPVSHEEWLALGELLESQSASREVPDLDEFLKGLDISNQTIRNAKASNIRTVGEGFRFELSIDSDFRVLGPNLLDLANITPGDYLVTYENGTYDVHELAPAQLSLEAQKLTDSGGSSMVQITAHNNGAADSGDLSLITNLLNGDGTIVEQYRTPIEVFGGESEQFSFELPTALEDNSTLQVSLLDEDGQIAAAVDLPSLTSFPVERGAVLSIDQMPILLLVLVIFSIVLAVASVLALTPRSGQSTT